MLHGKQALYALSASVTVVSSSFIFARSFLLRFSESVSEQFSEMESQVPRTVIATLSVAISELMHPAGSVPPSKQFVGDHNYGVAKRAFIPPPWNQT